MPRQKQESFVSSNFMNIIKVKDELKKKKKVGAGENPEQERHKQMLERGVAWMEPQRGQ